MYLSRLNHSVQLCHISCKLVTVSSVNNATSRHLLAIACCVITLFLCSARRGVFVQLWSRLEPSALDTSLGNTPVDLQPSRIFETPRRVLHKKRVITCYTTRLHVTTLIDAFAANRNVRWIDEWIGDLCSIQNQLV